MADREMTDFLNGVIGVVEANSYEKMCLWSEYTDRGEAWRERADGLMEIVGHIDDMPICLSLQTVEVKGHKVLFFDATSQVVDHRMIDKWLVETLPKSAFRPTTDYVNKVDAMNFHNVFHYVDPHGTNKR